MPLTYRTAAQRERVHPWPVDKRAARLFENNASDSEPSFVQRLDLGAVWLHSFSGISKGLAISTGGEIETQNSGSALSLLFAAGRRPEAESIRQLAEKQSGFSISFDPSASGGSLAATSGEPAKHWLELLANGLTYDLVGLAPGTPAEAPPRAHAYGLAADVEGARMEALTIRPGPHLAGGHALAPVVRSLAWLGAMLAAIEGVEAIAWHPARCWSAPGYFRESVLRWVEGGVFPGLGMAALALNADGGMHSEGLALFTGQELRIEPELTSDRAEAAKIGVRLIDCLVETGRIEQPRRIAGPDGMPLRLEPSANGRFVRVWRG